MSQLPETRTLPSGLHVNVLRPTIDIAPLSNKQTEEYLTNQPGKDDPPEVWLERSWKLLAASVNNAARISGTPPASADQLKDKFSTGDMIELNRVILEISGLVVKDDAKIAAPAGEDPAALSTGDGTSVN